MMTNSSGLKEALEKVFFVQEQDNGNGLRAVFSDGAKRDDSIIKNDMFKGIYGILKNSTNDKNETNTISAFLTCAYFNINKDDGTLLQYCILNSSPNVVSELLTCSLRQGKNPISVRRAATLRGDDAIESMVHNHFTKQDVDTYLHESTVNGKSIEDIEYDRDSRVSDRIYDEKWSVDSDDVETSDGMVYSPNSMILN